MFASRRSRAVAGLVCIALMLVAVNLIAARVLPVRLDLTDERLYTLSRGTRLTLSHIDEPVTLRFYYSARLGEAIPAYGVYAQRVRELLDQYVAESRGKLRLEVYQPQPFSDVEDRAVAFGLQGVPLNTQGEQVYFGLAGTNSTDDQEVVAFFAPERERFLEYDLTRLVHTLAYPKRTVVGLLTALPVDGDPMAALQGRPNRPLAILAQMRQLHDVETLSPTLDAIPANIDVLLLVHPHELTDKTQFAVDQFVLRGGKAIIMVDPYSELAARGGSQGRAAASDLPRLFKAWGVKLLPDVVAADRRAARKVVVPNRRGGGEAVDYIAWLNLRDDDLNRNDPVTANLRQLTMAGAGILEALPGATTTFEPLVTTSLQAMKLPAGQLAGLPDVAGMLARFKSDETRYVLAARITGPVETAFPDGPPSDPAPATPKPDAPKPDAATPAKPEPSPAPAPASAAEPLRRSMAPASLIIITDSDLLDDRFWARSQDFFGQSVVVPVANNADFIANAIEVLAGGEDLVGLRSRGVSARPFTFVEDIQREADDRYAAEQQALQKKLQQAQAKLRDLTGGEQAEAGAALSPEQARAVEQFRADMVTTRRELRGVQAALRQDIEKLKLILEFVTIALVPLLVTAAAIVVGALRRRRWHRRRVPAAG